MQDSRPSCEYLIKKVREGDQDSFLLISETFDKTIRKMCNIPMISDDEKNDLYQEGLIGLYKAVLTYKSSESASFSTFANICIKHSIISATRTYYSNKNYPIRSSIPLNNGENNSLGLVTEPEMLFIERESYSSLLKRIDSSLSTYERKVLKLFLLGISYNDISDKLDTSVKSVDNAVQRIRGKLKILIGENPN